MNKYPSERLFCLTIVLTVDEKWFTARIKHPQVRRIPVADGMSEDTVRFRRLESLGSAPGAKIHAFWLLVLRESRRSLSVEPVQLVTLWAKATCTGMNGVKIMTRVPRRHGNRHGE